MPVLSSPEWVSMKLERREWRNTIGSSGMTPTAFAFLIPVFVIVVFCPFLCVFCIRKRRRAIPPIKPQKKPALRREEARQRLALVTDVSNVTDEPKALHDSVAEVEVPAASAGTAATAESSSVSERECAICLCSLHAPSPPEPALLASQPTVDEAATPYPPPTSTDSDTSTILKLQICGHEFHSECLVSWFVLRKTSCPICRAVYISKEDMKAYEDEEAAAGMEQMGIVEPPVIVGRHVIRVVPAARMDTNGVPISNWMYFWRGEGVWNNRQRQGGEIAGDGTTRQERSSRWRRLISRR